MAAHIDNKKFNPFPGLRPFAPEDSDLFFGREGESEEVVGKLIKNRFVTVIGASGSGKSSLIYCGVLPKVRNHKEKSTSGWRIISFRPGNDPFGNLADVISEKISEDSLKPADRNTILTELRDNAGGIAAAVKKFMITSNEKVLIVVDQFEEIFRYSALGKADAVISPAARFVDYMVDAVTQSDVEVYTIVTMRSDFIGECAHYQGLTQLINNSNYLVPHMGTDNYREAIEGPVKYAGAKIDPKLVDLLLSDIGDRTDQLPVLQHAMMRTWTHWRELDEPDKPISKVDYDSVGTMSDAMSLHANEAYEELSLRGKEICEMMFKTITEKGSDNKGIRHPSSVPTIKSIAACTSEELFDVVEKFRVTARSFITPRENVPLSDESIIDLSHESLMRLWDRLREWVDDEASSVQMYTRLSDASAMYQQGKTSLWRPPDLQLAINWRDQHKPTLTWAQRYNPAFERAMVYLRTSEKTYVEEEENKIRLQKRQMKRTKIVAGILGVAAIISVGFMLFAFVQKIAADRQTQIAIEQKAIADSQKVLADTATNIATKQRLLAVANATLAEQEAENARIEKENAERQRQIAVLNENLAKKNEIYANEQKDSATLAKERADKNAEEARIASALATKRRMLSIGKAMSIKSLQASGQQDLQTLLAYQAYLFNKNNGGAENDADIYAGLYNVSKLYGSVNYKTYTGHKGGIKSVALVPGKNEFYTSGEDGQILKWDIDAKEQTLQIVYSGTDIIEVLAVSPDASWLACGSSNSTIKMIPLKPNIPGYELTGSKGKIKSLIFSYDGKYLYSASLDGRVLKWDLAARTNTNVTNGTMSIISIDLSSNGNYLAGISSDGSVLVWNPQNSSDTFQPPTTLKNIKVVKFNPESNLIALGDINGTLELWDINKKTRVSFVKAHTAAINDIKFNTKLKQMATASNDYSFKIFNISDPADLTEPPITIKDHENLGFVLVLQFSSDGQLIISGAYDGTPNLISRPTHVDSFVNDICNIVSRNMTQDEWNTYVGKDIDLQKTCPDKNYNIKVNAIK
ncbi:MAG: High-affnity carbon uptake protein Hat/HatR [Bacteroidales bacterium]|nr:High-affnity carbon uptake protein Hat/HatR [Bacteroidales bacterium]